MSVILKAIYALLIYYFNNVHFNFSTTAVLRILFTFKFAINFNKSLGYNIKSLYL